MDLPANHSVLEPDAKGCYICGKKLHPFILHGEDKNMKQSSKVVCLPGIQINNGIILLCKCTGQNELNFSFLFTVLNMPFIYVLK